eukprot:gene10259-11964_t
MFDITEEKITVVEKIDNPRQRLPNMEAIYFLTPTTKSIDLLINDFKKKSQPQYQTIHLFLTSKLPETEFKKLSTSLAVQRIKTFKEINIEFLANETQVFHFDEKHTLNVLFSPDAVNPIEEQARIATRLVTFCVTMNEYPVIRYSRTNPVSAVVAGLTQEKLDHIARTAKNWAPSDDRSTLLILDRSQDPLSPLLHEFTYQAMIYDLFKIDNDKFTFDSVNNAGVSIKKEVLLGETDYMWKGLRHKHIADVIEYLKNNLDEFLKTNQVTQYTQHNTGSLKEASDVIRSLPQYQEIMAKYSTHINLAEQASQKFTDPMSNLAHLEQDMATGQDVNGNTPKNIVGRLSTFLSDPMIEKNDKIRLLMIYIITQEGVKDADRKKLLDMAGLNQVEQSSISNLFYLGVTMVKGAKGKQKTQVKRQNKNDDGDIPYEVSRYVPMIKDISENLVADTLPEAEFPYVKENPMVKSANAPVSKVSLKGKSNQPRWADPVAQKEETKYSGSKLIIFVLGGISFSEMRSIYEVAQHHKRNIYLGSTGILLPEEYVGDIQSLKYTQSQF